MKFMSIDWVVKIQAFWKAVRQNFDATHKDIYPFIQNFTACEKILWIATRKPHLLSVLRSHLSALIL